MDIKNVSLQVVFFIASMLIGFGYAKAKFADILEAIAKNEKDREKILERIADLEKFRAGQDEINKARDVTFHNFAEWMKTIEGKLDGLIARLSGGK